MKHGLDLGVLDYFSAIFPALLVFVLVYAILEKTKMLGESKPIHAIVAIVAAFMVMLSKNILEMINFGAPWFILVFVFGVLLIMIYRFMGASEADLSRVIRTDKALIWFIFAIGILIVIVSISQVYGQRLLEQEAEGENITVAEARELAKEAGEDGITYRSELHKTFFNSKVLGLIFIFLVAVFTISLLTRESI